MKHPKWYFLLFLLIIPFTVVLTQCVGTTANADPRGADYAGQQTCKNCHKAIYESHLNTWHNLSTRAANNNTVSGNFKAGDNKFAFNDSLEIRIEQQHGKFYQVAYKNGKLQQQKPLDIVFGGKKATTYLYWQDKRLFELPLSYFNNLKSWTNSPGYSGSHANFARPIVRRCFECHSSAINEAGLSGQGLLDHVEFEQASLINGIDCERCHGPAARHVEFHTANPATKLATFIKRFNDLTRGQKIDMCAVCHSGNKENYLTTTFNFRPGDTLAKFKEPGFARSSVNAAKLDVHGNQYGLLTASKCFYNSKMDCTTCHDMHTKANKRLDMYAKVCIGCHQNAEQKHDKLAFTNKAGLIAKCIDCHMPAQSSTAINVRSPGGKLAVPYSVRNHFIRIYKQ